MKEILQKWVWESGRARLEELRMRYPFESPLDLKILISY